MFCFDNRNRNQFPEKRSIMARKDAESLLRNFYCFLEILQTSRLEEVSSWDRQSLDNAMKWAAFAEQVNGSGVGLNTDRTTAQRRHSTTAQSVVVCVCRRAVRSPGGYRSPLA